MKYSTSVEPKIHSSDDSNLKQIEAKILDFNWLFVGGNAGKFLKILAETENDEIFACSQISVFIDFMWNVYYNAIFTYLFVPFVIHFVAFILYTGHFCHVHAEMSADFVFKVACIVVLVSTYIIFVRFEVK